MKPEILDTEIRRSGCALEKMARRMSLYATLRANGTRDPFEFNVSVIIESLAVSRTELGQDATMRPREFSF